MKEIELRKHTTCNCCGQKVLHTGLPLFWRVTVERFGVDMQAAARQDGLAAFIGSTAIARVMGPDQDMARPVMTPVVLTLCEQCAMTGRPAIAHLAMANAEGMAKAEAPTLPRAVTDEWQST